MGGQRNAGPVDRKKFQTAADMARALPHHFRPIADTPTLTQEELVSLSQCEAAVDTLQWAFWCAGKALQIIRDGRLYRATHATFEDYVWARWGMHKSYATRLIRTWRIAEAVFELESNKMVPIGTAQRVNQSQVWELVSVADAWDTNAAAFVYRTLVAADGVSVTAEVLKGAVTALPLEEDFRETVVTAAIREYLAELTKDDDQGEELDYEARAQRAVPYNWLRKLVQKDRASAEAYLDHVQQQINRARSELLTPETAPTR